MPPSPPSLDGPSRDELQGRLADYGIVRVLGRHGHHRLGEDTARLLCRSRSVKDRDHASQKARP